MTFLWIMLGALYLVALISLGVTTFRKGHYLLFWVDHLPDPLDLRSAHAPHATSCRSSLGLSEPRLTAWDPQNPRRLVRG